VELAGKCPFASIVSVIASVQCPKCNKVNQLQANFFEDALIEEGSRLWPKNDLCECLNCGLKFNVSQVRKEIEKQANRNILFE